MDPGEKDRLVTFMVSAVTGRTDKGGPVKAPVELAKAWAKKADVSDRERIAAQQVGATMTTRFTTYWNATLASIDPKAWIVCDGRSYDISGVKEIGTRVDLEFTATARTDTPRSAP